MKINGSWLTCTTDGEDLDYFFELYDMYPQNVIADYELQKHIVPPNIKAVIVLEYDGSINQSFIKEHDDMFIVWADGRCDTIFNTDGIAFLEWHKDQQLVKQWALDNSPFEMNDDDLEECRFDMSLLPEGITRDQVIFVTQL